MAVHHLDCCTMCPLGHRFVNTEGFLVGHVLAVELPGGDLALVDTGIGSEAMARPRQLLGPFFTTVFRPTRDVERTARRRLEILGRQGEDVRHVVVTHLDADHAGGLSDFPHATVHVHARELAAARSPRTFKERQRYRPPLWAHHPHWSPFGDGAGGERWFGFSGVRPLAGLGDDIVAVPLPGHTRGHTAVAVRDGPRWLLHTGDAYFHGGTVHPNLGPPSRYLEAFERGVAMDRHQVAANHQRLAELAIAHHELAVFSAHDPTEFARLAADTPV